MTENEVKRIREYADLVRTSRKVYLCGGINGLSDDRCRTWREYAKERLECETIDPMRRDYRGIEDQNVAAIIDGDKSDIDACDVLLVNATRPSWGTAMEVLYAWERGRPCYCIAGEVVSPWLRYHSAAIFADINDAIRAINAISPSAAMTREGTNE